MNTDKAIEAARKYLGAQATANSFNGLMLQVAHKYLNSTSRVALSGAALDALNAYLTTDRVALTDAMVAAAYQYLGVDDDKGNAVDAAIIKYLTVPPGPVFSVQPAITGIPTVGQTLTRTTGTALGTGGAVTYTTQWVNSASGDIAGATGATYVLTATDEADTITARVTATDSIGATSAVSNSLGPVAAAPATPAPVITSITENGVSGDALPYGPTAGGMTARITGTTFTGATDVTFGGTAATSVTVVNSTTITCVIPVKTAGVQNCIVTTPAGSSNAQTFTYTAPATLTGVAWTAVSSGTAGETSGIGNSSGGPGGKWRTGTANIPVGSHAASIGSGQTADTSLGATTITTSGGTTGGNGGNNASGQPGQTGSSSFGIPFGSGGGGGAWLNDEVPSGLAATAPGTGGGVGGTAVGFGGNGGNATGYGNGGGGGGGYRDPSGVDSYGSGGAGTAGAIIVDYPVGAGYSTVSGVGLKAVSAGRVIQTIRSGSLIVS